MTANEINRFNAYETKRHNLAMESENFRHNVAGEQLQEAMNVGTLAHYNYSDATNRLNYNLQYELEHAPLINLSNVVNDDGTYNADFLYSVIGGSYPITSLYKQLQSYSILSDVHKKEAEAYKAQEQGDTETSKQVLGWSKSVGEWIQSAKSAWHLIQEFM